jgi:hypothetical protein
MEKLLNSMSESDKKKFEFDVRKFKWNEGLEKYYMGIRTFLLKQDPKTIPACQRNMQKLKIRHNLLLTGFAIISLISVGNMGQKAWMRVKNRKEEL